MRSALTGDILYSDTINSDTTGSWLALNGKPIPFGGLPLAIMLQQASASGSAGSLKVTIQDSADGSTANATLFEKTYTIPVSGGISVEEIVRIPTKLGYVRAVFDFTGTIDADLIAFLGFVTGDVP